jgi:uncharacterized protein YjdB
MPRGVFQQLQAYGTYSDGSTIDLTSAVNWTSSNSSVVSLSSSGVATGIAVGTVNVSASLGGTTGQSTVTITGATLKSISLSPPGQSIASGLAIPFTAVGTYSDGTSQALNAGVVWTSSNTSVATVNSSGLATGLTVGSASVTATMSGISGVTPLTVTSAALRSIAFTPANPSLTVGSSTQLIAAGTYSDGTSQALNAGVVWTSSNTSVATVNSSGLATGLTVGSASVTAKLGSISAVTTMTVTAAVGSATTLKLGTISGVNLNLTSPITVNTKKFYFIDQNGDGVSDCWSNDGIDHLLLNKVFNAGSPTTDNARTVTVGGYRLLLATTTDLIAIRTYYNYKAPPGWTIFASDGKAACNYSSATLVGTVSGTVGVHNNVSMSTTAIFTNAYDGYGYNGMAIVQVLP